MRTAFVSVACAAHQRRSRSTVCSMGGLQEILDRGGYEALLLDQFGVLHDGRTAYQSAIECVQKAREQGLKIAIVSNTSRRSKGCAAKLKRYGFEEDWFDEAVTSGELAHEVLTTRRAEFGVPPDVARTFHTNWFTRGPIDISDTELKLLAVGDRVEDAQIVLSHGTEAFTTEAGSAEPASFDRLLELLRKCAQKNLRLLCANPDRVTVDGGDLVTMPGALALKYEEYGGSVSLLGKPEEIVYEKACELLGISDRRRLLAVGDSLEHDILGAQRAGIDSLFIAGGIFASDLGVAEDKEWEYDPQLLSQLIAEHAPECQQPTYAMSFLRW